MKPDPVTARTATPGLARWRLSLTGDGDNGRGIAQLMRLGWFRPVHVETLLAQEVRALRTARKLLLEKLRDVDNRLRGILRGFGLKVGRVGKAGFAGRIRELVAGQAMPHRVSLLLASLPDPWHTGE